MKDKTVAEGSTPLQMPIMEKLNSLDGAQYGYSGLGDPGLPGK